MKLPDRKTSCDI